MVLLNPHLLDEADACDRAFAATHTLEPLSGIVVVIKDNYDTAGLQTTGGSLAMKGFVPATDATMVVRPVRSSWENPTWRSGPSVRM